MRPCGRKNDCELGGPENDMTMLRLSVSSVHMPFAITSLFAFKHLL